MVRLSLLASVVATLPFIFAHPGAEIFSRQNRDGCGTESPPVEFLEAVSHLAAGDAKFTPVDSSGFRIAALGGDPFEKQILVDTWVHVVAASEKLEDGWIPEEQITAQIAVLNDNFAPQNIQFVLKGVTRTIDPVWAVDALGTEITMKTALRKGDYKTLNLYFLKFLRNNNLGYAYYPQPNVQPGSRTFNLYGATNRYDSVPGGTLAPYNLGKTVTHEVGHWFGLMHTFEGYSCTGPGDFIADTAIHNYPSSGCPVGLDTCPDDEGPDPIHNYMDYSIDSCYEAFTPLQGKRMHDMWNAYINPRACNADNCLRALRATTVPGRLAESQEFCIGFTQFIVTDLTLVKPYAASACSGNVVSRVSSACSCLPTPTA